MIANELKSSLDGGNAMGEKQRMPLTPSQLARLSRLLKLLIVRKCISILKRDEDNIQLAFYDAGISL